MRFSNNFQRGNIDVLNFVGYFRLQFMNRLAVPYWRNTPTSMSKRKKIQHSGEAPQHSKPSWRNWSVSRKRAQEPLSCSPLRGHLHYFLSMPSVAWRWRDEIQTHFSVSGRIDGGVSEEGRTNDFEQRTEFQFFKHGERGADLLTTNAR